MTSMVREPPGVNGPGATRFRAAARGVGAAEGAVLRRRWGRVVVGVSAALLGAWVFVALYISAGDRREVVVMARDVGRFEPVEREDLRVVRMSEEPGVEMVRADRVSDLVGRVAAVDLFAGALVSDDHFVADGTRLVGEDEAIVGLVLGPGEGPGEVERGAPVLVVLRPLPGEEGELREVEGWVHGHSDEQGRGERSVQLVVPREDAGRVSAGAADGRVTIVGLAE